MATIRVPRAPEIKRKAGVFDFGDDPSAYIVNYADFPHPSLGVPGGPEFEWPLGTEGFRLSGSAALAIHRYIGDNDAVVQVSHRSETRIEMTGQFPGRTGVAHMRALRDVLEYPSPAEGKVLSLPGINLKQWFVFAENWDFAHDEQDFTDSIDYTVSFVKVSVGKGLPGVRIDDPDPNPGVIRTAPNPKGKPGRYFTVQAGARSLRAISAKVYGDSRYWETLYNINKSSQNAGRVFAAYGFFKIPMQPLPLGLRIYY